MSRVPIRETEAAEECIVLLQVRRFVATDLKATLDGMASSVVVEMLLPLLHEILKARVALCSLCNGRYAQTSKTDVRDAVNIRQIVRETLQPQRIHDVETAKRPMTRIITECQSITRFTDQMWSDGVCHRQRCSARVPIPIELSDCRQIRFVRTIVRFVPCPSSKERRTL